MHDRAANFVLGIVALLAACAAPPVPPTPGVSAFQPNCAPAGAVTRCHDARLGFTFEYPASWGALSAHLSTDAHGGSAYDYTFDPGVAGWQAGGRSAGFGEGRETTLMDFAGFDPATPAAAVCQRFGARVCVAGPPAVIAMAQFPLAERICSGPGPGTVFVPTGLVAVNLPGRAPISGLLFAGPVLSAPLQAALDARLGRTPKGAYARCADSAARAQFDAQAQVLAAGLPAGTLDGETQANWNALTHLAQSIRFE